MNSPSSDPRPDRELQALREVGRTDISPAVALALCAAFVATLAASLALAPLGQGWGPVVAPFAELGAALPRAGSTLAEDGLFAANRELKRALEAFEEGFEAASWQRRRLLAPLQARLTAWLGVGNEQAYLGRAGWLYYRPDVDYVTGPGFLEPRVLERRARAGDLWQGAPQPDPVAALVELAGQLEGRGIRLVVAPTPVKPVLAPAPLAGRRAPPVPVENPSYGELLDRLEAAGIAVVPLAERLAAVPGERFLRADTHWLPEVMERAAAELAAAVEPHLTTPSGSAYQRREVVVEGVGDIAAMLTLPAAAELFERQQVRIRTVLAPSGRRWRADPGAELLLLGDSFTNVFSDPRLGWGQGAGLAEQLAFELARPVDKVAVNAGGAYRTREALARDAGRLEGKRVVVYQFAERELAFGDWRRVELP